MFPSIKKAQKNSILAKPYDKYVIGRIFFAKMVIQMYELLAKNDIDQDKKVYRKNMKVFKDLIRTIYSTLEAFNFYEEFCASMTL